MFLLLVRNETSNKEEKKNQNKPNSGVKSKWYLDTK